MKSLIAPTEDFIKVERTVLDADASAGSDVTLTLKSNNSLAQNDFIVIGREGAEIAELEQINLAVSGNTQVRVATLKYAHKKGEPVTKYRYNQRKFYGATTKTGTYSELTSDGSPKDIQVDDPQGTLLEYTGLDGFLFFKATYYNSQTGEETAEADSIATEADESKRYCSLYDIRKQAGLTANPFITDGIIETYRKRAENEVDSAIFHRYALPLEEIPAIIENATTLLAAGYLDYQEFGREGEGVKWLGEARGILKSIKEGKQRLLASDRTELTVKGDSTRLMGWPDNTTGEDDPDSDVKFKMSDKY